MATTEDIRESVFFLHECCGSLCYRTCAGTKQDVHGNNLTNCVNNMLSETIKICKSFNASFEKVIETKILINEKKYDISLAYGEDMVGRGYLRYSDKTGVTKVQGQSLFNFREGGRNYFDLNGEDCNCRIYHDNGATIHELSNKAYKFALDRGWHVHDSPRNLLLALFKEISELGDLYTWCGEEAGIVVDDEDLIDKTLSEIADVAIYALRFARTMKLKLFDLHD